MIKHVNGMLTSVPHGKLAKECLDLTLELKALKSGSGWYLGTFDDVGPVSRESVEYFKTKKSAENALITNSWTQRAHP